MVDRYATVKKISASELKAPLETLDNPNYTGKFGYANIVQNKDGTYKSTKIDGKDVIDVISWSRTEEAARATAVHYNDFFESGFPAGRTCVVVDLAH